jgi:hypothetical protein
MSDNGFISRWQRTLRDDPKTTDLDWKVGVALSTYADQYTDEARGWIAGHHARPGVVRLSQVSHVARRYIRAVTENLISRGYIEQTAAGTGKNSRNEYRLIIPGDLEGP